MTITYDDVMIDIETTGLQPDRNCVIQIAAVKFNLKERKVDPNFFIESLSLARHRHWDPDTKAWWDRQPKEIMQDIVLRAKPPEEVMKALQQYCLPIGSLRFWSKPTHFDYMFLQSYFSDYGLVTPFSYREATDMNSYLRGIYSPDVVDTSVEKSVNSVGLAHNALNDCLYQIKVLFAHADKVGV